MTNRDLGMNRPITRRDFVGGLAVAISGGLAWRRPGTFVKRNLVRAF